MNTGLRCDQFQYILVGCEVDAAGGDGQNSSGWWLKLSILEVLIQRCIQLGLDRFSTAEMPLETHCIPRIWGVLACLGCLAWPAICTTHGPGITKLAPHPPFVMPSNAFDVG